MRLVDSSRLTHIVAFALSGHICRCRQVSPTWTRSLGTRYSLCVTARTGRPAMCRGWVVTLTCPSLDSCTTCDTTVTPGGPCLPIAVYWGNKSITSTTPSCEGSHSRSTCIISVLRYYDIRMEPTAAKTILIHYNWV